MVSIKELPTFTPLMCKKVKAIPPPIIISSTLSSKLSMRGILSCILAPPSTTKYGFWGYSSAFEKYSSSRFIRSPAARIGHVIPTIEECARCAVPNASFTNMSPSELSLCLKTFIFSGSAFIFLPDSSLTDPSSSMWNLKFSSNKIS